MASSCSDLAATLREGRNESFSEVLCPVRQIDACAFSRRYEVGKVLGSGMNGEVREITDRETNCKYALKTLDLVGLSPSCRASLVEELRVLRNTDHPNIIRLYEIYEEVRTERIHMVMELCPGGELFDRLIEQTRLSESSTAHIIARITSAVATLHRGGICHRDIKPENVLFTTKEDSVVKLIDFGLSQRFRSSQDTGHMLHGFVGTVFYMAPEVVQRMPYDEKCDIWSIGVMTYTLLVGEFPFNGIEDEAVFAAILAGLRPDPRKAAWNNISPDGKDFIMKCLVSDPAHRMTAQQALEHSWLLTWDKLPSSVSPTIVESLRKYAAFPKIKKAALNAVARTLDSKEISSLRKAFYSIDRDRNGVITLQELKALLMQDNRMSAAEAEIAFEGMDVAHNHEISYYEFLAAAIANRGIIEEARLLRTFHVFDVDGDGFITEEELRRIIGQDFGAESVESMIGAVDIDGDGRVSFDEFRRLMISRVESDTKLYTSPLLQQKHNSFRARLSSLSISSEPAQPTPSTPKSSAAQPTPSTPKSSAAQPTPSTPKTKSPAPHAVVAKSPAPHAVVPKSPAHSPPKSPAKSPTHQPTKASAVPVLKVEPLNLTAQAAPRSPRSPRSPALSPRAAAPPVPASPKSPALSPRAAAPVLGSSVAKPKSLAKSPAKSPRAMKKA